MTSLLKNRNVKPTNVIISQTGDRLVLTDFQMALPTRGEFCNYTHCVGSPGYLDPAFVRSHVFSAFHDFYSAGVVMFQLFARQEAVDAKGRTLVDAASLHLDSPTQILEHFADPETAWPEHLALPFVALIANCLGVKDSLMKGNFVPVRPSGEEIIATLESLVEGSE